MHWSVLLLPSVWLTFGLPLLLQGEIKWGLGTAVMGSLVLVVTSEFNLRIDVHKVEIRFWILFFPYRVIRSITRDLIIDHPDGKGITIISSRRDSHSEDIKNKLRFSYTMDFDGDEDIFYINYRNKEVDFSSCCYEFLWTNLIKGLKRLDDKGSELDPNRE